jgi:antitoxin VapB
MKTAKIFKNGQSQAVRLPKEFRFAGKEVFIRKIGNAVHLIPCNGSWDLLVGSLKKFTADFMPERTQPRLEKRERF